MKHILLTYILLLNLCFQAQENNKFSLDLNVGSTNPFSALSKNYYANYIGFVHLDLGGRYMVKERIGFKLDVGLDRFKNDSYGLYKESLPFQTLFFRTNIQGVVNLGKILHFSDFTKHLGFISHAGFGYSIALGDSSVNNVRKKVSDNMFNIMFGFTPQFKLSDKMAFNLDLTLISNLKPDYNFDFKSNSTSPYGLIANISIGASYYIGKNKIHYDWKNSNVEEIKDSIIIPKIDSSLFVNKDIDKDGVLNDDDMCPEEFGVKEFQGCPKPEITFDCYLNEFPVFQFNKARYDILDSFKPIVDSIAKCMLENSTKKIIIYGYTDNFGDSIFTQELSFNRANTIRQAIILKGITSERIIALGEGTKKASLPENSSEKIKHNRVAYIETISSNQNDIKELESGTFLQGLFFTIQLGAYQKPIKNKFNKFGKVLVAISPDKLTRYSVGVFQNYEDAYEKWKSIRRTGSFPDAYITAYFLGERITIKKAQELLLFKGSDIIQK